MINSAQTCQTGLRRLSINYLTWKRLSAFLKCYNNLFAVSHPLEKCDTHIKWNFQPGVLSQFWHHWEETDFKQALRKFSETAKGWYLKMEKLYRKYAVKLHPMILVDNQFTCYWFIWNTVQNRKVILLNYDIWNEKEWTGTGLNWTAELILSSVWSVSLKLCSDWLGEL